MAKSFSERHGYKKKPETPILEDFPEELKTDIWNWIFSCIPRAFYQRNGPLPSHNAAVYFAAHFFKTPIDQVHRSKGQNYIFERLNGLSWYQWYDLIEFLVEHSDRVFREPPHEVVATFNRLLEQYCVGYRFVNGVLAPITNLEEKAAIEEVVEITTRKRLNGAQTHIMKAAQLLSLRPSPDYRNSIKESISAVESVAKAIAGYKKGGLEDALNKLSSEITIHPAMKLGFEKLYGYTSDDKRGIRHPILDENVIDFEEAKFMLVACSAFVHYLISNADKAGLLQKES